MTHLSDFSYLQRDAQEIYLSAFLLLRMWQADGFKCLSPRRVINGELRSIVTWFMFLLMIAQASWDFLCTYIKYTEGFMQVSPDVIISKPFEYWAPSNQDPIEVMNYIQCVTFSLQVSILLLLQCFWNYLSNVVAKHSFMGSKEFTFYIVWTVGTIAMFPVLNYFYKHTVLEEVVPQTAYSCEILVVALLGFRNHTRFNRLIKAAIGDGKKTDHHVTDRLAYFRDMNLLLSVSLVAFGGGMFILCIDGFTENKIINSNKFAADLLICNTNISSIFLWLIIIGIFHPARVAIDSKKRVTTDRTATQVTRGTAGMATTTVTPTIDPLDNDVAKAASLSPPRYAYANNNNNQAYYMDSTKVLTKESDSDLDYMDSLAQESINMTTPINSGGLHHPRHYQRSNVVSIDDPYANEPISFSMINSAANTNYNANTNNSNAMAYASAVDHYHAPNHYYFSPSSRSPSPASFLSSPSSPPPLPFSSPLPPPPPPSSSNQPHFSPPFLGLQSTAASPPPNQELPPIPVATTTPEVQQQQPIAEHTPPNVDDTEVPWLDRSTSPGRR
ncbi:hypothetical protein BCR42DRAFT_401858 [Absidia repens]|uniref:Uncharacterized protein n=1 Tax=Absidia repens TaxID=90262 RepID=A0A1X2J351_9FUNG|nr:hypothetical protein BCR42DRAFT_401858 [Absidia repens]